MYTITKPNKHGFRFARLSNGLLVPNQGGIPDYDCSRDDHVEKNFQIFRQRRRPDLAL